MLRGHSLTVLGKHGLYMYAYWYVKPCPVAHMDMILFPFWSVWRRISIWFHKIRVQWHYLFLCHCNICCCGIKLMLFKNTSKRSCPYAPLDDALRYLVCFTSVFCWACWSFPSVLACCYPMSDALSLLREFIFHWCWASSHNPPSNFGRLLVILQSLECILSDAERLFSDSLGETWLVHAYRYVKPRSVAHMDMILFPFWSVFEEYIHLIHKIR